jgi:asparagine synthase (glutamine-hydrolysing)
MCGLVGVVSSKEFHDHKWLTYARKTLNHRGPDDHGLWWSQDNKVGMAHNRLSIIDLSKSGHQPMHIANKGLSIIFNGEIYNFRELRQQLKLLGHSFCSQTDTEVLLTAYAEWGTDCLKYLNGAFAFAVYDSTKEKLFIARDRVGEKPLFYRLDNETLYFASELKALLSNQSLPRKIDLESLDCYLSFGFVPGERCIYSGYQKLKAAHALTFDIKKKSLNIWRYWYPRNTKNDISKLSDISLINELELLLEDSVKKQLVADVPVGILLSGGIDSSLIVAMASRHADKINTFCAGFSGHENYDETKYSDFVASFFKTKHITLEVNIEKNLENLLNKLVNHFDEPIVDSSMIPTYLMCQEVKKYCSVALGGDGGDELFGGYNHYQRLLQLQNYTRYLPDFVAKGLAIFGKKFMPMGFKGRNYLQSLDLNFKYDVPLIATYFNQDERQTLMGGNLNPSIRAETIRSNSIPKEQNLLTRAMIMDFENYLTEDILVKVDRASMAHSLEMRAPFLDYRLIEFAFNKVPPDLKTNLKYKKILLKKLALRILPPSFNLQRKQGFALPLNNLLKKGLIRDFFWDVLFSKDCLFSKRSIIQLFSGLDKGRTNSERLFCLVQFELWRKFHNAYL